MPFADYDDFEACERANSDKRDPAAYCAAIKRATEEADVDDPPEVTHLAETDIPAEGLDALAEQRPNEWGRFESEHGVAWVGLSTGLAVYTPEQQQEVPDDAVSIDDPGEAPEDARTLTGPRGGLYYVPGDGDGDGDGGDAPALDVPENAGTPPSPENLANRSAEVDESPDPDTAASAADNHYIPGLTEEDVVATGSYGDQTFGVVDSWEFGGMWDEGSDAIIFDETMWNAMGDEGQEFGLAHETAEKDVAAPLVSAEDGLGHSDAVGIAHEEINQVTADAMSDEELEQAYEQWVDAYEAAGQDPDEARESADYTFRGTGIGDEGEQAQSVTLHGLSQEALADIRERYNVDVAE